MPADISSPANPRIKWLVRLSERRHRDDEGVFVVEGERLYTRAVAAGIAPEITFVTPEMELETTGTTITVESTALDKASYRQRSQGVIGVFPQLATGLSDLGPAKSHSLVLVAEHIEKPGNLGAMLRTAAAAGADALVAVGRDIDAHNPNVIRASTGALFTLPLAIAAWDDLQPWLAEGGIRVLCASPDSTNPIWGSDLTRAVALVVGAEDEGLSPRALAAAEETVAIPQSRHGVDSLNVSVAAAILLFEARRQRS